jgi:hypothetical protein
LLTWLEFRLLAEPNGADADVGHLSHDVVEEIETGGWGAHFPGMPLQAVAYILLRSQQMCLSETIEFREQRRFQQMLATRQLATVLDLMRLVIHRTMGEPRLPEAATMLDQLQEEGFNIEHQRFRDPYEAHLVSIADTERFEGSRLPLFVSLDDVSGDLQADFELSEKRLGEWHRRIVQEASRELVFFLQARRQPLPRAHLLHQLVRFATSWMLARCPWPLSNPPDDLVEEVRQILPEHAVRHLVRPRKGYEIKSKQELSTLIVSECRRQQEALRRVAASSKIQGLHDFSHFVRYLVHQHWREKLGVVLSDEDLLDQSWQLLTEELQQPDWVVSLAQRWAIDLDQVNPHGLESVRDYLREVCPAERLVEQLETGFVASENERRRVYQGLMEEVLPVIHHLVVGYGRAQANLPRLSLDGRLLEEVPALITLLAPTLQSVEEVVRDRVHGYLTSSSAAMLRETLQPHLHNVVEWRAFLAWEARRRLHGSYELSIGDVDAEQLLRDLEDAASRVVLPPHELFTETVQAAVLELLQPSRALPGVPPEVLSEVLALLPRADCGACGYPNCRTFAQALLFGQTSTTACVQLPAPGAEVLRGTVAKHERSSSSAIGNDSLGDIVRDHRIWLRSSQRVHFQNVLSPAVQKSRQLLTARLRAIWQRLNPKPRIFKWPSAEEFYQGLCLYLGYEAAERLQRDEQRLLMEHGDARCQVEWRAFKERRDWLALARRQRQGQPTLRHQDSNSVARQAYDRVFFLHQLSQRDRELVLRHRLERHQDGFRHWWNDDLLTMNLPGFSIRDWEDFSKIIKNAYWHQETSLPGGKVLAVLQQGGGSNQEALPSEANPVHMLHAYLERLLSQEQAAQQRRQQVLEQYYQGRRVSDTEQLRELLDAFLDDRRADCEPLPAQAAGAPAAASSLWATDADTQQTLELEHHWKEFQSAGFAMAPGYVCRWEELTPEEQEVLEVEMTRIGAGFVPPRERGAVICSWDQPLKKRAGLVRSMLLANIMRRQREDLECTWLQTKLRDRSPGRPPLGSIRLLIRQRLRSGLDRHQIQTEMVASLVGAGAYPGLIDGWCADLLQHLACKRQHQLSNGSHGVALGLFSDTDEESVLYRFPMLTSFLDRLLDRHLILDRERLLHYLFLLAKMEGNLDALTALLREIRETSDIIEAAWLRFTEERVVEGPAPRVIPGVSLGIPLLVTHLKDKEAINRGLRDGIGRREKRQVVSAYRELVGFIRYHVLVQAGSHGQMEDVIHDLQHAGYDLQGIDEDALSAAVAKEWQRREQLREQRIWTYATVTARRLAAQHAELQEAERLFYKARMELLKDGKGATGGAAAATDAGTRGAIPSPSRVTAANDILKDVVSRRGVALGQIKEEMYRQLSDLLEDERLASFQKRIRQIVEELDHKRWEIHEGWYRGQIDQRTVFYLLRQFQKNDVEPTWEDFHRFLVDHWFTPVEALRSSLRPDREQRLLDLDERFRALLGVSLLQLEQETSAAAQYAIGEWLSQQNQHIEDMMGKEL